MSKMNQCLTVMTGCLIGLVICYLTVTASIASDFADQLGKTNIANPRILSIQPATAGKANFHSSSDGFSAWFPGKCVEHSVIRFKDAPFAQSYMAVDGRAVYWVLTGFRTVTAEQSTEALVQLFKPKGIDDPFCDASPCSERRTTTGSGWKGDQAPIWPNYMQHSAADLLVARAEKTPQAVYTLLVVNSTQEKTQSFFNSLQVDEAVAVRVAKSAPQIATCAIEPSAGGTLASTIQNVIFVAAEPIRAHNLEWALFCSTILGAPGIFLLGFIGSFLGMCIHLITSRCNITDSEQAAVV